MRSQIKTLTVAALLITTLTGCGNTIDRLRTVGQEPPLNPIHNPVQQPGYTPVTMPMPLTQPEEFQKNSLWRTGSRSFFKDQRASTIGDILTVMIEINDEATIDNETERTRSNTETAGLPNFLGLESNLTNAINSAVDPSTLVDATSDSSSTGSGSISRAEEITLRVAAVVSQILPNGNMVIHGRQEVRVNFEVRELAITGVIRREDIRSDNTISYDKIAEARISYGGRGHISDVQQPRYGQQVFDIISPF